MTDVKQARDGIVVVGGGMCYLSLSAAFTPANVPFSWIGAVGVEMAAELKILNPEQKVTLIHSRKRLLSSEPLPDDFAERVESILRDTGVEVMLGQRVTDTTAVDTKNGTRVWNLTLSDGQQLKTGHVLNAVSQTVPTSTYLPKEALNEEGYIKVHRS